MFRQRLLAFAAFLVLGLLSACGARQPLPQSQPSLQLPQQWHVHSELDGISRDWLLVLQQEGAALRFSLFTPLGVPVARQRLEQNSWQADGLLPPFAEGRELFAACLFALTPAAQLEQNYPSAQNGPPRRLAERWQVEYLAQGAFVIESGAVRYRFTPLTTEATQ